MFKNAVLETDRLIIRPVRLEDDTALHAIVSQDKVMHFLPEGVMSLGEVRDIIRWLLKCYDENTPQNIKKWTLAVVLKESSEIIGWCGLGPLDYDPAETELFYGLSRDFWGRGIATEAAHAVMQYGLDVIRLNRIVAVTDPDNVASVRVLEKLGMKFERREENVADEYSSYEGYLLYSIDRFTSEE